MVNGPPTPPATTSAELLDAARSTPSVPNYSLATHVHDDSQLLPEVYQRARQEFGAAIARKDYQSLVRIAEEIDIIVCTLQVLAA